MDRPSNRTNGALASQIHSQHPTLARESSTSSLRRTDASQSTRQTPLPSQAPSTTTSTSASPYASREPSPTRPSARSHTTMKTATAAAAPVPTASSHTMPTTTAAAAPLPLVTSSTRSRRSSPQDPSPSRSRSGRPTLASQKTASLHASNIPTLPPAVPDASPVRSAGPQKSEQPQTTASPRWPISPRLRSPPPVLNRPNAGSASASTTPAPEATPDALPTPSDSEAEEPLLLPGMRTPVRGNVPMLETVQEASPLGSSQVLDAALEKLETVSLASDVAGVATGSDVAEVSPNKALRAKHIAGQGQGQGHSTAESGSESAGNGGSGTIKHSRRTGASASAGGSAPPPLTSRQSSSSKNNSSGSKGKSGEGSLPTMTVETETVTSIPSVNVGQAAIQGSNGSLRTRPSSETIRPKKDKKRSRKQNAVPSGAATSKADIFEAKVASAVDEANTSDSEETFVYDSNPADNRDRPHRFHHSRTPSATSVANDRSGMRSIHSVLEGPGPSMTVRKSMKFVNTFGNSSGNDSGLGDDESKGSAGRGAAAGSGRGTARLHHHVGGSHIGRWGLSGPKNGHQSIFDNESPFPVNSTRLKLPLAGGNNNNSGRLSSDPASPRTASGMTGRGAGSFAKRGSGMSGGYDMDDTTTGGADDERTPLMSSVRGAGRNGRPRRHHTSLRSLEQQSYHPPVSFLNRFASCLVLTVMLMLVISGAIGFMFATSQPLEDIELVKISGVLASEQELMFDLMVRAHNPNVVVVTVDAADMEVFAKSPHAGTDSEWWRHPKGSAGINSDDSDDSSSSSSSLVALDNKPRDQPDSSPNFLLGKFTEFDNPLSFEGSFFHHGLSTSRSGVRIRRPGNGTDGGSERWERILQDEFDLIVKGVLRYSLPLSQRVRSALIEGRTTVKPNAAEDPSKNKTVTLTAWTD